MTKEEVKNKILGFIEAVENIEIESEFQSLRESGLDSLGLVSVIVSIEQEFGIEFLPEDLEPIDTLDGLIRLTEKYL